MTTAEAGLLARLEELRITRQVRLGISGAEHRLVAAARQSRRLFVSILADVVHSIATEKRSRLAELFLRRGYQAEIMLCVLKIVFSRHRIAT